MNKIYIKKRLNKETKKAAENDLSSWAFKSYESFPTKNKRKRRHHRTLANEQDADEYTAHINKCNLDLANFNNNTSIDYDWTSGYVDEVGYKPLRAAEGVSREDKKLHYYLDMIRRQESAEKRKNLRKEAKLKNQDKAEKKILNLENVSEPNEPLQINLVTDFDPELDILAEQMKAWLWLSSNEGWAPFHCASDFHQAYKDDKEDTESWLHSDNHSDSTLDRLRTPVQTHKNPNSFTMLGYDNIFDSLRISNMLDDELFNHNKPCYKVENFITISEPIISSSNDKSSKSSLNDTFLESILKYTKQVQNASKDVKQNIKEGEPVQAISKSDSEELKCNNQVWNFLDPINQAQKPKSTNISLSLTKNHKSKDYSIPQLCYVDDSNNSPRVPKPIFFITRTKDNSNSKFSRLDLTTDVSTSRTESQEYDRKTSVIQPGDTNVAVLLLI